jgi:eukaryotic-like serine/threonine-protein kinase
MRFGRYDLIDRLREGRMSETFIAKPAGSDRGEQVLVLRLLGALRESSRTVEIFNESSQILLGLKHHNIVPIIDFDVNDGWPYVVTENHGGIVCSELLKRSQESGLELSGAESVFIVHEVLQALTGLHTATDAAGQALGLLHGDIGPDRVLICPDGQIKLDCLFVGSQQLHNIRSSTITSREQSFRFAPEQVLGLSFDSRADIFNAAVMLVELLIRRPLFIERSQLSTLLSIRDVKLDILNANRQRLPPKMDLILLKALSKDPDGRYGAASEMAALLSPYFGALSAEELQVEIAELVEAITSTENSGAGVKPAPALPQDAKPAEEPPKLEVVTPSSPPPKVVDDVHTRPTPVPNRNVSPPGATPMRPTPVVPPMSPSPGPASDHSTFDMVIEALAEPRAAPNEKASSSDRIPVRRSSAPVAKPVEAQKRSTMPGMGTDASPPPKKTGDLKPAVIEIVGEKIPEAKKKRTTSGDSGAVMVDLSGAKPAEERPRKAPARPELEPAAPPPEKSVEASLRESNSMWAELELSDDERFWAGADTGQAASAADLDASTLTMPIGVVSFRREGQTEGPFNLATALDKISLGEYGPDDEASLNDGPFQRIRDVKEFDQPLVPPGSRRPTLPPGAATQTPLEGALAEELEPPTRRGLLDDEPTSRLFFQLKVAEESCLVVFEHGPIRKDVYLKGGDAVLATSTIASESLAEFLVRKDAISRMELEMALAMKTRFDESLGNALDGLGIMSPAVFDGLSRDHLRSMLLELFRWSKGEFRVYAGRKPSEPGVRTGLSTYSLILEGLRARMSPDDAEAWIVERAAWSVGRLSSAADVLTRFKLPEVSNRLLRGLTPSSTKNVLRLVETFGGDDSNERYHVALTLRLASELALIRLTPPGA